jgi:uncharacterized protein with HEPN domain
MFKTTRDWKIYIQDILFECENIKKFTANCTYESFTNNLEKVYAVAKSFENIGEAVKQIPKEITDEFDTIPWSEIARMRVFLTHHYFGVDDKILWDSLDSDFVELEKTIQNIANKYLNTKMERK